MFGLLPEQCLNMMLLQVMEFLKKMAGTEYVSFSNATWVQRHVKHNLAVLSMKCFEYQWCSCSFQSEKETGDRNYAIGYYLKEKKVIFFWYFMFYFILISITLKVCWVEKYLISSLILIPVVFSSQCGHDGSPWLLFPGKTWCILIVY